MPLVNLAPDVPHGRLRTRQIFLRGQRIETLLAGQLHIDADAVRITPCQSDELLRSLRDRLQMNVAAKLVHLPQLPCDLDHQFHRVVRTADDPAAQEQSLDVVPLVEIQRQLHHLVRREPCACHIAGPPVDAVVAVIQAGIRHEHLHQRDAAPVRCVGMANAHPTRGAHARATPRILPRRATARARSIILRCIGQDFEFAGDIHHE